MVATLTKAPTAVRLLERATGIGRVDAETGIIHGVKIIGLQSRNTGRTIGLDAREFGNAVNQTYSYSKEALKEAIPLYEHTAIRFDHPQTSTGADGQRVVKSRSRPCLSTVGELRNVRLESDGLRGDIHLLTTHPHSAIVLEIAERMPHLLSLSHNADGQPELQNGRAVITKLRRVFSVDLIGDPPGTTNGLFESHLSKESEMTTETEMTIEDLRSELLGVLDDEALDDSAKLDALRELLTADAPASDGMMESLGLFESLGREPTTAKVKAVTALRSAADRKALIESWPKKSERSFGNRPRTSPAAGLMESDRNVGHQARDAKDFVRRLRSPYPLG